MKKNEIMDWLVTWFTENSTFEETEIRNVISESYFEKGIIDSFTFIQLISDIETEYQIQFANDQFEDRSFATIEGLTAIIERSLQ